MSAASAIINERFFAKVSCVSAALTLMSQCYPTTTFLDRRGAIAMHLTPTEHALLTPDEPPAAIILSETDAIIGQGCRVRLTAA